MKQSIRKVHEKAAQCARPDDILTMSLWRFFLRITMKTHYNFKRGLNYKSRHYSRRISCSWNFSLHLTHQLYYILHDLEDTNTFTQWEYLTTSSTIIDEKRYYLMFVDINMQILARRDAVVDLHIQQWYSFSLKDVLSLSISNENSETRNSTKN